ncbi:efflux transporter outer membrane subunit [Luteimonas terrae]|uniref:NodT family efflux transporter outer membrane factor (OMF) lipoprotein n=1 Tax=Luteimonas terrae TaxID=1530191 RepID=A0ABU1XRF0_9GAMM|nr:efflux transporter outer membrane subunit [Luteimonas terrae]MDR7191333.1 NodT family efflux transporter outer membrane factor (OMF) lipoprotein [Luteimonas terrae]
MIIRRLTMLAAALTLAACSTPPVRERPPLPATYYTPAGDVAQPADPAALARWWRQFDDPLLAELVETALVRNLDQQAALAELRIARAQLRQSRSALLPRLDLGGQASRQIINTDALADTPLADEFDVGGDVNFDTWQLALQAEWEVDLFGANRLRRDGAGRQVQSAEAQLVAVRLAVASNLAQGYVQARALLAQRALLDEGVRIAREAERIADGRFRLGEVTRLDIEAAGAQRAALEAQRGDIDAGLAEAAFALDTLIDQPHGTVLQRLGAGTRVPTADVEIPRGQPLDLLRRRPDVIAAVAGLDAAELAALASRRDLFPKLGVSAALGRSGVGIGDLSGASDLRSLAAQLGFPWLDFGASRAAIDLADAQADAGFVQVRQALATALQDVETASAQLAARRAQRAARAEALARAQRTHDMARRTYDVGLANLADLLDAERALLDARQQSLDTDRAFALAQIALYTALGGGWSVPHDAVPGDAVRSTVDDVPDRIREASVPRDD